MLALNTRLNQKYYKNLSYITYMPYIVSKRALDIFASILGLILVCPTLFIISIFIKIDSPGPVFFKQDRVGQNGRVFRMYKFRTMFVDAEKQLSMLMDKNEMKGHLFKIKKDPRITKIGQTLRKTSLDELPQLLNVLKGDMSLVGPRPPLQQEYSSYEGWQTMRVAAKPGMTGLWQISGRSSVGFDGMVRLDLKYIREKSLLFDIRIVLKTFPLLFGDKNAY